MSVNLRKFPLTVSVLTMILCYFLLLFIPFGQGAQSQWRLPKEVIPLSYDIRLEPSFQEKNFEGRVRIHVRVLEETKSIFLHSSQLKLKDVTVDGTAADHHHKAYEIVEIQRSDRLAIGDHIIDIKYSGVLNTESEEGLAIVPHEYNGRKEFLISSSFQPTYARRAFPCFDEPAFKAVFNFSVLVDNETYSVLSNMPTREVRTVGPNQIEHVFESSLPMSTYTTAVMITKQKTLTTTIDVDGRSLQIRTFVLNPEETNTRAINFIARTFTYLSDYFNLTNPITKIDMVEYNRTIAAGTEDWGLTRLKPGILSLSSNIYSDYQSFTVLAHELIHYWYGNLVTNDWWSDIWLQESVCEYLSYKVVDEIGELNTTVSAFDNYSWENYQNLHFIDWGDKAEPVYAAVGDNVTERYNTIMYSKGRAILKMLDVAIGDEELRKLFRKVLEMYKWCTITTSQFVDVATTLGNSSTNADILREFLETWLYQNRFPTIYVQLDKDNQEYILTQKILNITNEKFGKFGYKWTIPVTYITSNNKDNPTVIWMRKDDENVTIPRGNETWIKFNHQYSGYYMVDYSQDLWNNLAEHINEVPGFDQAHLFDELTTFYRLNLKTCETGMKLISNLNLEHPTTASYVGHFINRVKVDLYESCPKYLSTIGWELGKYYYVVYKKDIKRLKLMGGKHQEILNCSDEFSLENARWIIEKLPKYTSVLKKRIMLH